MIMSMTIRPLVGPAITRVRCRKRRQLDSSTPSVVSGARRSLAFECRALGRVWQPGAGFSRVGLRLALSGGRVTWLP